MNEWMDGWMDRVNRSGTLPVHEARREEMAFEKKNRRVLTQLKFGSEKM